MSQFEVQSKEKFDELHSSNVRLHEVTTLQGAKTKSIQESCDKLSKASEETNKRINQVSQEQFHCQRDRYSLDQDMKKLLKVCQNMKPQQQGHALYNPYQEDIKPNVLLDSIPTSLSQYQDQDNMNYSENEALKQLPEAFIWLQSSGLGEYDHMELIDHIDAQSIPD
ncbi:hypothetical protein O181_094709 [Austropuccinia psidii MF-1]|uniref:Uncharacterized protein n=1 Tax=Austropuccinia psidii MF-1 TaxID=1389203 RepID=A0A9Q3J3Y4_9BASI|nr:hypothetical protein [Austropuccinia psidii MF-1]